MNILVLRKSRTNYISLVNDFDKCDFEITTVVDSLEELEEVCLIGTYDIFFVDYFFFEDIKGKAFGFFCDREHFNSCIWYGSNDVSLNGSNEEKTDGLTCFYLKSFSDVGENICLKTVIDKEKEENCQDVPHFLGIGSKDDITGMAEYFFVKAENSIVLLKYSDVLCMESERNYVTMYYVDGRRFVVRKTLQSLLDFLPINFVRINRSFIVNVDKIDKLVGNRVFIKGLKKLEPLISAKHRLEFFETIPLI